MATSKRFAALFEHLSSMSGAIVLATILGLSLGIPAPALAEDCALSVEQPWPDDLVASAHVSGPCDAAAITLLVHNGGDEVVWNSSYESGDLFSFDEIHGAETMKTVLRGWLGDSYNFSTSSGLPQWPQNADMPDAGEFPFYVSEGLSQADYEAIRTADYPMICYIQGGESTLCLVRHPGIKALISVGAQTFPG